MVTVILQHSCHKLFALFIIGEISLTSVVIRNSIRYAFPIILMTHNLKVTTRINCAAEGNTLLRNKQYIFDKKFEIAKQLVFQKIYNQTTLLKNLRYKSLDIQEAIEKLSTLNPQNTCNSKELMGVEGIASKIFFTHYFSPLDWKRREPRCKRDIPNLLLDIGYTYLFNFIEAHLNLYGFDLYCGVHHTFFYNRKSLVCDIIEPFRCIIDKRLRKAHNLGQINPQDFKLHNNSYALSWKQHKNYTKFFMKDILEKKEEIFRFCQAYYRWFMREKSIEDFPKFIIN